MELIFVGLGLLVGFLVGLTGVGGGALMTPSLIFLGVEPLTAVGTDLLYATVTRVFGIFFQGRKGKIRLDIASRLIAGGLPAIIIGALVLERLKGYPIDEYFTLLLGTILVVTAILSLFKGELHLPVKREWKYVYLLGFITGLIIQFTSIGAGVIVSFALMNVAKIEAREVVGVSLLYGLAISLMSFINHAAFGSVDYRLAFLLVAGTLPGVYLGTNVNSTVDREWLKRVINAVILVIGVITLLT